MKQAKGRIVFTAAEMDEIRELVTTTPPSDRAAQNVLQEKLRELGFRVEVLMADRASAPFTAADLDTLIRQGKVRVLDA